MNNENGDSFRAYLVRIFTAVFCSSAKRVPLACHSLVRGSCRMQKDKKYQNAIHLSFLSSSIKSSSFC